MLTPEIIYDVETGIARRLAVAKEYALEEALTKIARLTLNALLQEEIPLSMVVEALTDIVEERGFDSAMIHLERAGDELKKDEPPS